MAGHADGILKAIEKVRRYSEESGEDRHLENQVLKSLREKQPLRMVLPGFPCKSRNTKHKVLGVLPDKGERVALDTLDRLCTEIREIHPQGCELTVMSDGRIFADVVGVADATVTMYTEEIRRMLPRGVRLMTLENVFAEATHSQMRKEIVDRYGLPIDELHELVRTDKEQNRMYLGMTRFMKEDLTGMKLQSRYAMQKEAKKIALHVMHRHLAYNGLVRELFPDHLRLSIHPQPRGHEKIGINLIGNDGWGTPWHNVLVEFGHKMCLMKKYEAEGKGYELVVENGRPSHFRG